MTKNDEQFIQDFLAKADTLERDVQVLQHNLLTASQQGEQTQRQLSNLEHVLTDSPVPAEMQRLIGLFEAGMTAVKLLEANGTCLLSRLAELRMAPTAPAVTTWLAAMQLQIADAHSAHKSIRAIRAGWQEQSRLLRLSRINLEERFRALPDFLKYG